MKRTASAALVLIITAIAPGYSQEMPLINGEFQNVPLSSLLRTIEQQTGYRTYYRTGWIDSIFVNVDAQSMPVDRLLEEALAGTALNFAIDHNKNIFISKERRITTTLPDDFFGSPGQPQRQRREVFDFAEYERQERRRRLVETRTYSIGDRNASPEGRATVAGIVRDEASGEPVIGATVFIENPPTGVATDQFGYYSITLPKGKHELKIKSMGMKSTSRQIMLHSSGKLDIELEQEVTPLKEVVVESQAEARLTNVQMGAEKLDIQTMKQIPLALGETDVMKVVLTLPGVQTVGEGTVGLNVRGGAANQNLVLLNDAVVYNPSHLFGFFSTFNPDILKNVELYKSGITADYGGRLSSVLDVRTREGNLKKISGSGGLSPVTGRLEIEGPIIRDRTSFIIGARSTYSNWIMRRLKDDDLRRSNASFYDVTGGITHRINDNDNLYLSGYLSQDEFNLKNDTAYSYSDRNASVKWKHIFNNRLVGVLTGAFSHYRYTMTSDRNPVNAFALDFAITQLNAKADVSYFMTARHTVDAGISSTGYGIAPGTQKPLGNESIVTVDNIQREKGVENAVYVSDHFEVSQRLSVYAGVRYSMFTHLGEKDVFVYQPAMPRESGNVVDTVHYGTGKAIASYHGPEPRFSIRYSFSSTLSLKASYNRMRQYIQMLSNTTAITPIDIWKLTDLYIPPQVGDQVSVGFYKNFEGRNLIETSLEAYYKTMHNTVDYKTGSVLVMNHQPETDIIPSQGQAYGIELLVRKNAGKVNGWVSYAYSRSFLQTSGIFSSETINRGNRYPSNFDKPHAVNFIGNYKFSRRFNFSLNVIYSTGRPITLPVVKYVVGGATRVHYSERNAYRIPDYFRTDISLNFEGNHKIKKLAHSSWTFAVYNLLGRENAYSVYFTTEAGRLKGYKLSIFAQPIPTITYNFKF